jgi:hypothetical protein
VTIETTRSSADGKRQLEGCEVRVLDTERGRDAEAATFSGGERVLLGRKSEGVPSHRMQDVETLHALVTRHDVGGGIALRMADMETRTRWVWKHVENVVFGTRRIFGHPEGLVSLPVGLPPGFDDTRFVLRHGFLGRSDANVGVYQTAP